MSEPHASPDSREDSADGVDAMPLGLRFRWWLAVHKVPVQIAGDSLVWLLAFFAASMLRSEPVVLESPTGPPRPGPVFGMALVACLAQASFGTLSGLYKGRWRFGSFEEVRHLVFAVACVSGVAIALDTLLGSPVGPSVALGAAPFALVGTTAARYAWRLDLERRRRPRLERSAPALVFGAGEGGHMLITALLRDPESPWFPVAVLDDDPTLVGGRIRGVPVLGGRRDIPRLAAEFGARALLVAVPSASSDLVRELARMARYTGLEVRVLPPLAELLRSSPTAALRRPSEIDLVGRRRIEIDEDAVTRVLRGRRVLVVGAGGALGSELAAKISRFEPAALLLLDRDESGLHAAQLHVEGRALLNRDEVIVADITDAERIDEVFDRHNPEVVFHSAACGHLALLHHHPRAALLTNVEGTINLLRAASRCGTSLFVHVSSYSAAHPETVLGATNRLAERLVAGMRPDGSVWVSVRVGQAVESSSSAVNTIRQQIRWGGRVTLAHPDQTRHMATAGELALLVLQAASMASSRRAERRVLVAEIGEPVRLDELARQMLEQAESDMEIAYGGPVPGDYVEERIFAPDETREPTEHPQISQTSVPPADIDMVRSLLGDLDSAGLRDALSRLARAPDGAAHP
ncbi:MAG: dTDP-glucose 4,6-dehydratase [Acidimicrobiales bacterium]|nr:MAG: dTDP-glucose 4,6-dehydratase [Acidimicrobiales bacterium]